jgi:transcriptional regulator with XRE-family HTH domain
MMAERMISNKELGKLLGKDPATVSKWVTNTSQPSLENLIEIAKVLKCDIGDLVRKDETIVTNKTEEQI